MVSSAVKRVSEAVSHAQHSCNVDPRRQAQAISVAADGAAQSRVPSGPRSGVCRASRSRPTDPCGTRTPRATPDHACSVQLRLNAAVAHAQFTGQRQYGKAAALIAVAQVGPQVTGEAEHDQPRLQARRRCAGRSLAHGAVRALTGELGLPAFPPQGPVRPGW